MSYHQEKSERGEHGHYWHSAGENYEAMSTDGKLGHLIHELHHLSRSGMDGHGGQGRILRILAQGGDMTQRALTEHLGIQPGSASEIIGKLEQAGCITRSENAEDRRTVVVHLTEAGQERLAAGEQKNPELFSALNEEEKAELQILLEKLCKDWKVRFPREHRRHRHTRKTE